MNQIDFLPQRYRDQLASQRAKLWHLMIICLVGGVMAAAALWQFGVRQAALSELTQVEAESNVAQAKIQRVAELQARAKSESADAELMTWLRHPWPRTQLLGAIVEHLPSEVTLEELRLEHEEAAKSPTPQTAPESSTPATAPKLSPPAADLAKLRAAHDSKVCFLMVIGETQDIAALHAFLARIGSVGLYSKVELVSIESGSSAEKQAAARFKVKLTVRRGFGQAGGPQALWRQNLPPGDRVAATSQEVQP